MRWGVTGLEHRPELVVQLRERLGTGLEWLILDDAEPGDERTRLAVGGRFGRRLLGSRIVAHGLRI